ncbi:TPA: hypothetical protein SL477_001046 [Pseudomonas aeruginosa]|nr:hypothetical protein [Pseudomonas aeruginosa]
MTESKICTCPSGDGSLVHPCPAHPAVEQAGGDERAAFEAAFAAMGRPVCRADYDQDAYGTPFDDGGWTGWQARAALAQPSPAQSEQHWPKLEKPAQVGAIRFRAGLSSRLVVEAAQRLYEFESTPEQEAERPEVVAYRTIGRHEKHQHPHYALNYYKQNAEDQATHWRERGCEVSEDELMTVAQHERIVGALRAKAAQLREALEWRAENQAGQRELLRSVTAERDAALARVAELERGKVYVEARQCDECQHGGINDSATGVAACHECDWTGPEPEEDRCPGCQRENCMAAACPQCGARYVLVASEEIAAPVAQAQQLNDLDKQCRDDVARALGLRPNQERGFAWSYLLASIKSCVKASGDSAQAQHSVPEGWMLVPVEPLLNMMSDKDHDTRITAERQLLSILAAAPGKEGA